MTSVISFCEITPEVWVFTDHQLRDAAYLVAYVPGKVISHTKIYPDITEQEWPSHLTSWWTQLDDDNRVKYIFNTLLDNYCGQERVWSIVEWIGKYINVKGVKFIYTTDMSALSV